MRHGGYVEQHLARPVKKLFRFRQTVEGVRRDGTTFPVEMTITETGSDGNVLFVGTIRGISERRAMLAQLEARGGPAATAGQDPGSLPAAQAGQ